jgi:hypothetical protein
MSAQYNVCIKFVFYLFIYYFNSGYLFQGIDFAYGITSLVYPIVFFPFKNYNGLVLQGLGWILFFIDKMS